MKTIILALIMISGVANANVEFTKSGERNYTDAADSAQLSGQEALTLINSLKVPAIPDGSGYLTKTLRLDDSAANGAVITCSVADTKVARSQLLSAECFIKNAAK
jgi:hypothetical protein